jgi:hypothetical protein
MSTAGLLSEILDILGASTTQQPVPHSFDFPRSASSASDRVRTKVITDLAADAPRRVVASSLETSAPEAEKGKRRRHSLERPALTKAQQGRLSKLTVDQKKLAAFHDKQLWQNAVFALSSCLQCVTFRSFARVHIGIDRTCSR